MDISAIPGSCDTSDEIDMVALDGNTKTFRKTTSVSSYARVGISSDAHHFHGEAVEDGSSFEYIRRASDSKIFGSLVDVTANTVSQFRVNAMGEQIVETKHTKDFPEEADPFDDEHRRLSPRDDHVPNFLHHNEDISIINKPGEGNTNAKSTLQFVGPDSRKLLDDNGGNIDVLVLWTAGAECRNSGGARGCTRTATTESNMRTMIDLAVTETNTAFDLSGVYTQLHLAHAVFYDYTEVSGKAYGEALNKITGATDVQALRTQYGADLVALLIDDPQYCGLAWVGPDVNYAHSVTNWNCATGYYTFGHEIGHNLGCLHDKGASDACGSSNYNYGYRQPNAKWRTILAYGCASGQCDNNPGTYCGKIQRFSNPKFPYNGDAVGTNQIDNARHINEVKATVAKFYPHVSTCSCDDSTLRAKFPLDNGGTGMRSCAYVQRQSSSRCSLNGASAHCPCTCNSCSSCVDSSYRLKIVDDSGTALRRSCEWVGRKANQISKRCALRGVASSCRSTCGVC